MWNFFTPLLKNYNRLSDTEIQAIINFLDEEMDANKISKTPNEWDLWLDDLIYNSYMGLNKNGIAIFDGFNDELIEDEEDEE